jgi:hypothetical protein
MGLECLKKFGILNYQQRLKSSCGILKKGVILTKDNLIRRNWNGDKNCCFCHKPESIQHLFLLCYANFLWRAVHLVFGIPKPISMYDIFHRWCNLGRTKPKLLLLTVAASLFWAILLTRNKVVFDKCRPQSIL